MLTENLLERVIVASYKDLLETVDTAAAERVGGQNMRLTMKQRQAVTAVTVQRYCEGSKKVKRQILDEFSETTVTDVGIGGLCCVIMAARCGYSANGWWSAMLWEYAGVRTTSMPANFG